MKNIITILDNITETSMPFNEFVIYRAKHNKDENHILVVCSKENELPKVEIPSNVKILYVGKNLFKIREELKSIIKECKKKKEVYLIHTHQLKSAFISNFAMIGTGMRKKEIFTVHSTYTGYSFHNKVFSFVNSLFSNRITCVSKTSYDKYPRIIKRIKKDRIMPIQNGVDTERIDNILGNNSTNNKKIIEFVYVARVIPIKNHEFLIDVIKTIKNGNIKFTFIGSTSGADSIIKKCKEEGLEKVIEFTNLIPREEVFKRIRNADYYISSSTLEGMPISVLEAMYCELPVILSDIPQHRELANGNSFIPIIEFDIDKWKKQIMEYINMSNKEKEKLGKKSKEYVYKYFSLKSMHNKYSKIYEELYLY